MTPRATLMAMARMIFIAGTDQDDTNVDENGLDLTVTVYPHATMIVMILTPPQRAMMTTMVSTVA